MAEDEGVCPIESNIKHTIGRNIGINDNDLKMFENEDNEFGDSNDAEFDEEDGDGIMNADEEWDSFHSSNDGQDIIPVAIPNNNNGGEALIIGVNDENPYAEGNELEIAAGGRPAAKDIAGDPKEKCWICDACNAINNLLESFKKYDYKCCICTSPFHPNVVIIFSNDWDGINENDPNEQIHTVWNCPFCTLKNSIHWIKCDGCEAQKPPPNQVEISYSYIEPKLHNKHGAANKKEKRVQWEHNNVKNEKKGKKLHNSIVNYVRQPRLANIGAARSINEYPAKSVLNDVCEQRLTNIFGAPYKNKLLLPSNKNKWSADCNLMHGRIEWTSYSKDARKFVSEEIVARGFAINARSGHIATMSSHYIWIFACIGSLEYKLIARYTFTKEQRLLNEDVSNSRIRFLGNNVYVWSFSRSRIYRFKLYENSSLILVDVLRDKYFKDSQTIDVCMTGNLLILLFDRWCGVYKLYPKFEWYHAVAFATKSVNCFSLEIVDFDAEAPDPEVEDVILAPNRNKGKFNIMDKLRHKNKNKSVVEEKKEDLLYRETNGNYLFINAENQLIGMHPSNPTFDYLHIARDTQHGKCPYCISKYYGAFYLSNDGKKLYQSPSFSADSVVQIKSLNDAVLNESFYGIEDFHDLILRKGIERFVNVCYDEQFGISGRLLLFCETRKKEFVIHAMFNQNELCGLSEELARIDYYLMPGMDTDKKPFNFIIFVYQYLYGQDLVDTLLQSQMFNPALLKIKNQQERQLKIVQDNTKDIDESNGDGMDIEHNEGLM